MFQSFLWNGILTKSRTGYALHVAHVVSILLMKWNPYEVRRIECRLSALSGFNPSYEMESLRSLAESSVTSDWISCFNPSYEMESLRRISLNWKVIESIFVSILLMKWNPYEETNQAVLQDLEFSFNPSYEMESLRRKSWQLERQYFDCFNPSYEMESLRRRF